MLTRTIAVSLGALASGCAATQPAEPAASAPDRAESIVIDGRTADWPAAAPVEAVADARHLFVRFEPGEARHALQAAPFTTRILIDADADAATGLPIADLGAEAVVLLSPPNRTGTGIGSEVMLYQPDGSGVSAGHAALGFMFLPTYASPVYEARIDRDALGNQTAERVTVRVEQVDPDGAVRWSGDATALLPNASGAPPRPRAELPPAAEGAVRVLSLNVLHSAPLTSPDAFRRTIRAIDPDVILFQEWFNTAQPAIQQWTDANLGPGWTVFAPSTNGIAIATPHRVVETIPAPRPDTGPGSGARFAAAVIDTPAGRLVAASLHLKCCGGAGTAEDVRRTAEARSINATVADILARHPDAAVAIGGDYNLVGARTPLEILAEGLALDGADLVPVEPLAVGDRTAVTWVDEKSRFSPSRLDWILIDPARTRAAQAFNLDTRRLDPDALRRLDLQAEDSHATDHLPVVADLLPIAPGE